MDKTKEIEKFIRSSIKKKSKFVGEIELQNLFDQMTTEEIQKFWFHYSAGKAFSTVNALIPDWETKDQEKCFKHLSSNYQFYPKEKTEMESTLLTETTS